MLHAYAIRFDVMENFEKILDFGVKVGPCLVLKNFCKIF
jgi:hypothetical protein